MRNFSISSEDRVRLRHMLDAALEIQQYVQSATREDLSHDRKLEYLDNGHPSSYNRTEETH